MPHISYLFLATSGLLAFSAWFYLRRSQRGGRPQLIRKISGSLLALGSVVTLLPGCYLWFWQHEQGSPQDTKLFKGIRYIRLVSGNPRPVVSHLVFVDVKSPGISFLVTPAEYVNGGRVRAGTVGEFVKRSNLQIGINANFFQPFYSHSPWDYYPREGDLVEVLGIAASLGRQYSTHVWAGATLFLSEENEVQIGGNVDQVWNAIAGDQWLIREGTVVAKPDSFGTYARAGAGITADGKILVLAVVDGKQPGLSEGLTLPEFARMLQTNGLQTPST